MDDIEKSESLSVIEEPIVIKTSVFESYDDHDVFGHEEDHQIKFKTLTWPFVTLIMITEIVTNGTLALPQSLAVVGIVPAVVLIIFLGIFGLYTSLVLIDFKLNHPEVHNMGDAGMILFGPVGREVLSFGTVLFAVFAVGGQLLAAQSALGSLSDNKLCLMWYTGIFAIPTLLFSLPRTLNQALSWLSLPAVISIFVACVVAMAGAGLDPQPGRVINASVNTNFYTAFISITNPVFAYAGHFMFFPLVSEMRRPQDAKKAAWVLQTFATSFYSVFAIVMYVYIGDSVNSPALSSLPTKWAKASWGLAVPNILIAGALYNHTAAKIIFVRVFRKSDHMHSHSILSWVSWVGLVVLVTVAAFVLSIGVPIFSYLNGIAAALFASWYTYGLAGAFWLHDTYHFGDGLAALKRRWIMTVFNILTVLSGAFICVAGSYAMVKSVVVAYRAGIVTPPFEC